MTIKEKIEAVQKVQDYEVEITELLEKIIKDTYDYHCDGINNFTIQDNNIYVNYCWTCRGDYGHDDVYIPIEWLDEGFDYKAAYKEKLRLAELARKREEEKERRRIEKERKKQAKLKEKKEYEKYLELKKKYEGEK